MLIKCIWDALSYKWIILYLYIFMNSSKSMFMFLITFISKTQRYGTDKSWLSLTQIGILL